MRLLLAKTFNISFLKREEKNKKEGLCAKRRLCAICGDYEREKGKRERERERETLVFLELCRLVLFFVVKKERQDDERTH